MPNLDRFSRPMYYERFLKPIPDDEPELCGFCEEEPAVWETDKARVKWCRHCVDDAKRVLKVTEDDCTYI